MTEETKPMSLAQKLIEVRKSVVYLKKENRNEMQKYDYVSSSQVLASIRDKMNELGILVIPRVVAHNTLPTPSEKQILTEIDFIFEILDVDSEKSIKIPWYAQGAGADEKGPGKAMTYAEKTMFLKLFNIPTDKDDPDAWEEKTGGRERAAPEAPPQATPEPRSPEAQELHDILADLTGGYPKAMARLLKELSSFTSKSGKVVEGKESIDDLDPRVVKFALKKARQRLESPATVGEPKMNQLSEEELNTLHATLDENGIDVEDFLNNFAGTFACEAIEDIPAVHYPAALKLAKKMVKEKK